MTTDAKSTSVRRRLLNLAQTRGDDYNQLLIRYVGLRFLARLAASDYATRFLLKGATLFLVWHGQMHRPTSDIDLLGYGDSSEVALGDIVRQVCIQTVEDDGVEFEPDSVRVEKIREETAYGGLRCRIDATLGSAILRVQVDVGFGDNVTPEPAMVEIPRLLDDEVLRNLRAYTPETVAAEKIEAIVKLGLANSRMKDYLDLHLLLGTGEVGRQNLAMAVERTFERRKTPLPATLPIGLTEAFWNDEMAMQRWRAFLKKNRLSVGPLDEVCKCIAFEVEAVLKLLGDGNHG